MAEEGRCTAVTGASGFVGHALVRRLAEVGERVHGLSRSRPDDLLAEGALASWTAADVRDRDAVAAWLAETAPARVVHLAAMAHPGDCAERPDEARAIAVDGTRHVLEALPDGARAVVVSTAQVYGVPERSPVDEDAPLAPRSAYGRAKAAAEEAAREAARAGARAIVARPFNHSGPGQSPRYVIPAFAAALRRAVASGEPMRTGNLFPRRDFLHVDDVVEAYRALLERGEPGAAYNVASGRGVAIGELVAGFQELAGTRVETELDPELARADDPPEIVGANARLCALGWSARRSLAELLRDVWEAGA